MSILAVEHVYKVFGRRPRDGVRRLRNGAGREELRADGTTAAVIDASFEVAPGEIFVVMGLSGSGKSTLLRTLNGLSAPTAGKVVFDGQDLSALSAKALRALRARRISMVFQHFALFPHRSVLENAAYGLEVQGLPREERERRAAEALELVGLAGWEKSWPDELSGGMQQRVGLARALATDADLLLMDESFSALDPLIRRDMQDQLLELQQRLRKTIVFITHDLNEAMRLGDRVAVMRDGEIVQVGTAQDILVEPADDYVASFVQDVDRSRVLTAASIMEKPRVTLRPGDETGAAIRALRSGRAPAVFVLAPDHRLVGHVTEEYVVGARDAESDRVGDVMHTDCSVTQADTPLAELLTPAARSEVPLAVVDEQGRLTGVIPRGTLLAALGEHPETAVTAVGTAAATAASAAAGAAPGAAAPGAVPLRKEAGDA